jgi:hypothetical protein
VASLLTTSAKSWLRHQQTITDLGSVASGDGSVQSGQWELDPHPIAFAPHDSRLSWGQFIVTGDDDVADYWIERCIRRAGPLSDPTLNDHVGADLGRVVPQVVGNIHDGQRSDRLSGEYRVRHRTGELRADAHERLDGDIRELHRPMREVERRQKWEAVGDQAPAISNEELPSLAYLRT